MFRKGDDKEKVERTSFVERTSIIEEPTEAAPLTLGTAMEQLYKAASFCNQGQLLSVLEKAQKMSGFAIDNRVKGTTIFLEACSGMASSDEEDSALQLLNHLLDLGANCKLTNAQGSGPLHYLQRIKGALELDLSKHSHVPSRNRLAFACSW